MIYDLWLRCVLDDVASLVICFARHLLRWALLI